MASTRHDTYVGCDAPKPSCRAHTYNPQGMLYSLAHPFNGSPHNTHNKAQGVAKARMQGPCMDGQFDVHTTSVTR